MQVTLTEFEQDVRKYFDVFDSENSITVSYGNAEYVILKKTKKHSVSQLFGISDGLPPEYDDPSYDPYYKRLLHEVFDEKDDDPETVKHHHRKKVNRIENLVGAGGELPPEYDDPTYDPYYKKLMHERYD
ncbi:MAG: hypothetical protein LBN42_00505 [Oscillospiraceae bacterium]|jgi:hypothetical protein|nr:hypothetical protein [Oscillospiraceae bacterium]